MNVRILMLCLWPMIGQAQGFAGMASDPEGFALPQPGPTFDFPADHGAHPDFRIEWWYLTANMTGPDGTPYGLQWTLFRSAMAPGEAAGWGSPQVWFAHAAVTTEQDHFVAERFARGGIGQAGVIADPFEAWIDEWVLAGDWQGQMQLRAAAPDFAYDITLQNEGPLVFQGEGGFSVKSAAGQASYYYSAPFLTLSGTLTLPEGDIPVTGHAWIDREWSSQPLTEDQTGWDWFSLSFEDGDKFMGYRLRSADGSSYDVGIWINADGSYAALDEGVFEATALETAQVEGRDVPVRWRLEMPDRGMDITVAAINPNVWMDTSVPYWEGPVTVTGTHPGIGYLEMTGYE